MMRIFEIVTLLVSLRVFPVYPLEVVPGSGDFKITGIFPITNENKTDINFQAGIMMQEAMNYAIHKINQLNGSNFLYGYTLSSADVSLKTDEIGEYTFSEGNFPTELTIREGILQIFSQGIPFVIGPYSSESAYISSILTGTFQLISISYGAGYSKFANFGPKSGFMLRTIPSDIYRMQVVLELLIRLEWNYVAIVSSSGYDGEKDAKDFTTLLPTIGVCLADMYELNGKNHDEILTKLKANKRLKAVLMFTTNEDSKTFLRNRKERESEDDLLLLCVYGCTNYIEVVKGVEKQAAGVFSVNIKAPEIPEFKQYFLNLKPTFKSTSYFNKSWEEVFQCSLKTDKTCIKNTFTDEVGYYPGTPVHTVINAVSVIAETLRILIELICSTGQTWMSGVRECVINPSASQMYTERAISVLRNNIYDDGTLYLSNLLIPGKHYKKIIYEVHQYLSINNTYQNLLVGTWEYTRNKESDKGTFTMASDYRWRLSNGSYGREEALCSKQCPAGHIRERSVNVQIQKCCWDCIMCPLNDIVVNDSCVSCQETEKANVFSNSCVPLPSRVIELKNNAVPAFITMMSIVGLCFIVVVVAFFIKFNKYRLVRASGRDLCYMILFGLSLMFGLPFFFLGAPSVSTCLLRSGLPGVAFLTVYAPLFLKINRIYRIFCHAKKSVSRPSLVSSRSLLLLSFGIVIVQILLVAVWFISKVPVPVLKVSSLGYVTSHCRGDSSPILLLLNVALSVGFIISCTVLAFLTRHFPKNYNEAKVIGITLYITCVAWSIFLPVYFLIPETDFTREYFMSGICILIGYVTLFGLFGQKIWLLMCQKNLDTANGNLPTWYLSYSDCKENGDAMMARPEENGSSDETIA